MSGKRFLALLLAVLFAVTSINTGSMKVYAQEAELITEESVSEDAGPTGQGQVTGSDADSELPFETDEDYVPQDQADPSEETVEVTFDAEGGLFLNEEGTLFLNLSKGTVIGEIEAPVKEGFVLDGWFLDEEYTQPIDLSSFAFEENAVLYARWQEISDIDEEIIADESSKSALLDAETYTITQDANGGYFRVRNPETGEYEKVNPIVIEVPAGEMAQLSIPGSDSIVEFMGWYADREFSRPVDNFFIPTESMTVYAKWLPRYNVTLDYGEGKVNGCGSDTRYAYEGATVSYPFSSIPVPVPNDASKAFEGWYEDPQFTKRLETDELLSIVVTSDLTFYARYTRACTVTFDAGDGSFMSKDGDTYTVKVAQGRTVSSLVPTMTSSERKTFEGWYIKNSDDYQKISNIYSYEVTGDITLYAKYTQCFIITFHANQPGALIDGKESVSIQVVKGSAFRYRKNSDATDAIFEGPVLNASGVDADEALPVRYKSGNHTYCWTTNSEGTGNYFFFGDRGGVYYTADEERSVNFPVYGFVPTADVDFYLKWGRPVALTFDANGGTFKVGESYNQYGTLNADGQRVQIVPGGTPFGQITTPASTAADPPEGTDYATAVWGYYGKVDQVRVSLFKRITEDTTVYCKWFEKSSGSSTGTKKTVTLHAKEGYFTYEETKTKTFTYTGLSTDKSYSTTVPSIKDKNLAFQGWYYDDALTRPYPAEYQFYRTGLWHVIVNEDITDLYAKYGPAYTVTFDANGGYFDADKDRVKDPDTDTRERTKVSYKQRVSGRSIAITDYSLRLRKDGSDVFDGWSLSPDSDSRVLTTTEDNDYEDYTPENNVTLYAIWKDYRCPEKITIDVPRYVTLGDVIEIPATITPATFSRNDLHWYVSGYSSTVDQNPLSIRPATLTSEGVLITKALGYVSIYAELNGCMSEQIGITVMPDEAEQSVVLDKDTIDLVKNGTAVVTATVIPETYESNVTWSSSDESIATVKGQAAKAIITAGTKTGTAVITATLGEAHAEVTVNVKSAVVPIGTAAAPTADVGSGAVKAGTVVKLTSSTPDAAIYFTKATGGAEPEDPVLADGVPAEGTTLYTEEFVINETTAIKAVAYKNGLVTSPVSAFNYTVNDDDWGVDIENEAEALKEFIKGHFDNKASKVTDDIWFVFGNEEDGFEYKDAGSDLQAQITQLYTSGKISFDSEIVVYHGTRRLIQNRDYTITYANNVMAAGSDAAKAPAFTIVGKGQFNSSVQFTFTIEKADINGAEITSEKTVTVIAGNSTKLGNTKPVVTFGGKKLVLGKDYVLNYYMGDSADPGKLIPDPAKEIIKDTSTVYTIEVAAKEGGSFSGKMEETVTVLPIFKSANIVPASKLKVGDAKGKALSVPYTDEEVDLEELFDNSSEDKKPKAFVKNGKTTLVYGTDFTVDKLPGENYTSAGTANFVIRGIDKIEAVEGAATDAIWYVGDKTATLTIAGTDISKAKIAGLKTTVEYTGKAITIDDLFNAADKTCVSEKWNEVTLYTVVNKVKTPLVKDRDYKVSCENTGVLGKFDVVFTGINGCTGSLKKTITVKAHAIKGGDFTVTAADATYVKSGAKAKVTVEYNGTTLLEGIDYTVTYKNNTQVAGKNDKKAPTAFVKGIGNYTGSGAKATFNITQADISKNVEVTVSDVIYNPAKSGKSGYFLVTPKLFDDGKAVTVGNNKDIDAIAKDAYEYTYMFKTDLEDGSTRSAGDTVLATDKVPAGTTILVSVPVKISNAKSPYRADKPVLTGYYKVIDKSKDISKLVVQIKEESKHKLTMHNGDEIKLSSSDLLVGVKSGKTITAIDESNYEIKSITGNRFLGTATIIVVGKGSYGGSKKITCKITAKSLK